MTRFLTYGCVLFACSTLAAEEVDPVQTAFPVISTDGNIRHVTVSFQGDHTSFATRAGVKYFHDLGSAVKWWNEPIVINSRSPACQVAIVPYHVGGGTGVSVDRIIVIACRGKKCVLLHNGLWSHRAVSEVSLKKSFVLRSCVRPTEEGFTQLVRVGRPTDSAGSEHVRYTIPLQFEVMARDDRLRLRQYVRRPGATQLLKLLRDDTFPKSVNQWAQQLAVTLWPRLRQRIRAARQPKDFEALAKEIVSEIDE